MSPGKNIVPKIAFITSSLTAGGAQENIINLSKYLSKRNYKVDIIMLRNVNDYNKKEMAGLNVNIIPTVNLLKPTVFIYPYIFLILLTRLFMTIKKNRYDLIIGAHEYYPYFLTIFFSKIFKIKNLLMVGNDLKTELSNKLFFGWVYLFLTKISFYFSDKLVCSSRALANDIKRSFAQSGQKVATIYNGINIQKISRLSQNGKTIKKNNKEQLIATLGKLIEKKGHQNLIKAIKLVSEINPDVRLIIIGKGNLENGLKKLVHQLKLDRNVVFMGFVKNNPYKLLPSSKLFVFPSLYEGFGNVLIEAMACGLPVISCDCRFGPREILDDNPNYSQTIKKPYFGKYGVLVPPFRITKTKYSPKEPPLPQEKILAKTLIEMLKDQKLLNHYRKMSLVRVREFDTGIMGKHYSTLISSLITKKNVPD